MTRNSWRRTAFASSGGDVEIAPDDWTLFDSSGEPLARLYKVMGGPQDGRWSDGKACKVMDSEQAGRTATWSMGEAAHSRNVPAAMVSLKGKERNGKGN